MTDQPQPVQAAPVTTPPATSATPQQPGFLGRLEGRFLPHAEAVIHGAEAEGLKLTAEFAAGLQDHSGIAFDVAGDVLNLLKVIDPADDAAVAALAALLPKVIDLAGSAARIVQAALGKVVPQG